MKHTPGIWLIEGNLVYALESMGFRKGKEEFQNRFSALIYGSPNTSHEEIQANSYLRHGG